MSVLRALIFRAVFSKSEISWASKEDYWGECGAYRFNAENQPGSGYELLKTFDAKFRAAVSAGDFELLAQIIQFPIYLTEDKHPRRFNRNQFKEKFQTVLPEFRKVLDFPKDEISCNIQTVRFGSSTEFLAVSIQIYEV